MVFDNFKIYGQIIRCFTHTLFNKRKKILIVSESFKGGGLETRINHIVNLYHQKYHFVLLTQTQKQDMKIKPTGYFKDIVIIPFKQNILTSFLFFCRFDILDIHPFYTEWIADLPVLSNKTKLFYTLHGLPSVSLFCPPQKSFDKIITVSLPLADMFIQKFPRYLDKTLLVKNAYNVSNKKPTFYPSHNILFMLTNQTPIHDILNDIIDILPKTYTIHCIGYPIPDSHKINHRHRLIYDGFVDVSDYLKTNHFCLAVCRGGYAAMDLINHDIPTITVREKNAGGFYFDLITPDNFEILSNQNFVSWNPYHKKQSLAQIVPLLSGISSPFYHTCLSQFNSHKDITDYYE